MKEERCQETVGWGPEEVGRDEEGKTERVTTTPYDISDIR